MEHLDFSLFSNAVNKQFQKLTSSLNKVLVTVDVSDEEMYDTYLGAYPAELNTVFRERRHYDGTYDKNYIRRIGNVVAVSADGGIESIWNVKVEGYFQQVADAMNALILSKAAKTVFVTDQPSAGNKANKDNVADIIWTHFHSVIPNAYIVPKTSLGVSIGTFNETVGVFERGLTELTLDAFETVLELISSNSIYRGEEHKAAVQKFLLHKTAYDAIKPEQRKTWIMYTAAKVGMSVRFKNSVIGTLVEDLSNGTSVEKAVASFESKVAPQNYKRTSAVQTPKMIAAAQKTLTDLGLLESLHRRFAQPADINVRDTYFVAAVDKPLNVFDEMVQDVNKQGPKTLSKVEEISLENFLRDVVPTATSVELLLEGRFQANKVSLLTAADSTVKPLFKWNNHFSWAYEGAFADAIKENVKSKGGDTEGDFRVSLSWYNGDDLDLSVKEPNGEKISFSQYRRSTSRNGGMLDLDMNGIDKRCSKAPVENIIYKNKSKMSSGQYVVIVDQYSQRSKVNGGFVLQLEMDGVIRNFQYSPNFNGHHKPFLTVNFDGKNFTVMSIDPSLTELAGSSRQIAGLDANSFVPVTMILPSPNYWGENETGNKHTFFILDGFKSTEPVQGFFNEFLRPELTELRKVFEMLGTKTKATPDAGLDQVSGIGFSSTRRDKVTVRVTGKTKRVFTINL